MSRKLDFIIIGAQKSGTTSLHEYLRGHPRLFSAAREGTAIFTVEPYEAARWEAYSKRSFAAASPEAKLGKATPQYMVGGPLSTPDGAQPPMTTAPATLIPSESKSCHRRSA